MFTQLFDFKRAFLARIGNKRSHPRHAVGDGFPLQAVLALADDKDPAADLELTTFKTLAPFTSHANAYAVAKGMSGSMAGNEVFNMAKLEGYRLLGIVPGGKKLPANEIVTQTRTCLAKT